MLGIAGIVIIIVMTYQVYKTARDNGRNAALWALMTFGVGFGIQIIVPFFIGIVGGIVLVLQGTTDPQEIQSSMNVPSLVLEIVFLASSVYAMWLIFKRASVVPDSPVAGSPPPPPTFGGY